MKRLIYITILSILLPLGCSKPSLAPVPAPEQYDRYIFFSHGVETKAELVEDAAGLNEKSFGVVGFKYDFYDKDGNEVFWKDHKNTNPTPNVFYDEVVNSEGTSTYDITPVETVRVTAGADGTTADYSPLQGWSNNKKYAFFAFYPRDLELVNLDGDTPYSGGIPAVRYEMDPADLKASMVDVMTAPANVDRFWQSSAEGGNNLTNGEVNFAFSHRLSCLGLNIANLSAGTITLESVEFKIGGIKFHQAAFSLTDGATLSTTAANPTTAELPLAFAEGENSIEDGATKELSDKLIFIPQEEDDLSIEVTINYIREAVNGYAAYSDNFTTQSLTTKLAQGQKHIVNLKFTDSAVEVIGQVSQEGWSKTYDVNSSFK